MGNLLSYVLACDWVDVQEKWEDNPPSENFAKGEFPCTEVETFKAAEPGIGKSQEMSVELTAKDAGWIHRTGKRDRDLWFCPEHGRHIAASGL